MQRAHVQRRKNVPKGNKFGFGPTMCYVNCNLPRALPMNHHEIKKFIKDGDVEKLEDKLLNGEGYKLIGHYSTNPKVKLFLQSVPVYMARIDMLQECACKGSLRDMQVLLQNGNSSRNTYKISPSKLACSKDLNGTMRIPLHYICSCSEPSRIWDLMLKAGADPNSLDINKKTPVYYLECSESIHLPNPTKNDCSEEEIPIKPSNIRIWIHERNIGHLARVIWSGYGDKLLTETSKHTTVNKFLKAVPYILGIIREIHKAVIDNNIALLKKLNRDPVPKEVLASKDINGLTPLHKAAGLGRLSVIDYIVTKNPKVVNTRDAEGRTPLHFAYCAPPKNVTSVYNRLVKAGANENLIDKKGKIPKSYSTKANGIPVDLLTVLPKAPRIASEFPSSWDWSILYDIAQNEKANEESKQPKKQVRSNFGTKDTPLKVVDKFENINIDLADNNGGFSLNAPPMDLEEIDDVELKSNGLTLGEARQALNNGSLDNFLSDGGPLYRTNNMKDTNNNVGSNMTHNDAFGSSSDIALERNDSAKAVVVKGSLNEIANYILDGKHVRLLGMKSDDPAIQEFLDKVPFYANKIDQIHRFCSNGDLNGLMEVLDRRKFCLARECKTGLGLTPLHIAALYEQLDVFGYLAARFPETLKLTDFCGRSAMDYVTLLPDKTLLNALLKTDNTLKAFQTDYHALQSTRQKTEPFEPEKIREALGYVVQHRGEERTHSDMDRSANNSGKILSSVMSASRYTDEDRTYLTQAVGKPLSSGLKELIKRRPSNPTLYLAEHLTNHCDDQQSDEETGITEKKGIAHPQPWDFFKYYRTAFQMISRDEYGMSMLHYAASRTHNRNALFHMLEELDTNIGVRDEAYRTPRDIAVIAQIRENVKTIDKYIVHIIARGEQNKIIDLLMEGYDHILDVETDTDIMTLATERGHSHLVDMLRYIPTFEEQRERLHRAVRLGNQNLVEEMLQPMDDQCVMLATAKNERARCSLHIAVLSQNEEIVRFLGENFPTTLSVYDNIERTALHYAMAMDKVEAISAILITSGAKRLTKDLKGKQPSYYFMNKKDIHKLQDEEDELRLQV
ncbi:uncharacterized protein LOC126845740 isoform X2 [Adelges cooleyi]|uniref:uncharacterized protein LOC126845740 isoform X2 n=1 Tax=Adelges cooleyi TaxID=133065 RepID=UPI0021807A83|nr:uncharacterized protein LOC126845740 isoform X2 [Adelges cooleyi]